MRLRSPVLKICAGIAGAIAIVAIAAAGGRTLDIYFVDVEGGQATLLVTPAGQSFLIDAGFAGTGGFDAAPGDPHRARDANRIAAAARAAGVRRIDVLLITHFHADHDGGVTELATLLPIALVVDHGAPSREAMTAAGTAKAFGWYQAVRATTRHLEAKPGDRVPLTGVDVTVVSSAAHTLDRPLPGSGEATPGCGAVTPPEDPAENPRSTGVLVQFGRFRFLDIGDLSGEPLFALFCPTDMIGPVDVYLNAHHGGADTADAAIFRALRPRVDVVDNSATKGGAPELLAALSGIAGLDAWQLHRADHGPNAPAARIANLDDTTSHWIRVSAGESGAFTVTNPRTGSTIQYAARR